MKRHHYNEENFIFDHCDTVELAKKYGTPLYVLSENIIKKKCEDIRVHFLEKYDHTKAAYASKAFLTKAMCKIIEREGLELDVVSSGELNTAKSANFPMEKVLFHGNNKSYEELVLNVENNVGTLIVDNIHEFNMLEEITNKCEKVQRILFRMNPDVEGETHKYISTGQKDSKFGISLEKNIIVELVKKAIKSKYIELRGFHFHIGSQLLSSAAHLKAIGVAFTLMKDLKDHLGFETKELNVGGGFGIGYEKQDDETKPISYFIDPIMKFIAEESTKNHLDMPIVTIEPGRWIVAEAGVTLYTLGAIKEIPGVRTYANIDGGMTDNIRPALYNSKYDAIVANKCNKKKEEVVTIAGKCCESGDILILDLEVPKIEPGDTLAVLNTGAYNFSMSSNYNRLLRPPVLLISDGKPSVVVKRQTYEHLLEGDIVPKYLE